MKLAFAVFAAYFVLSLILFPGCKEATDLREANNVAIPIESGLPDSVFSFKGYYESDSVLPYWLNSANREVIVDSVEFGSIELEGQYIFMDSTSLNSLFPNHYHVSNSTEILECGDSAEVSLTNYFYKNYQFSKVNERCFLMNVDLRNNESEVVIAGFKIGSKTSLATFKKQFPNSYNWRNYGTNWTMSLLSPKEKDSYNYFVIKDNSSQSHLVVSFADDEPFYLEFRWSCDRLIRERRP